ncbi:hypothetical protein ACFSOZ_04715 [Mesorhizobium newzealandense]|uniref:Glycine-rich cell wall protein n=1 Tax=Mesorhizobium newzealandense TaxID=1300302 RepID=A0ABW4U8M7_9HYPH
MIIAPYQIAFHGYAPGIYAASAQAGKGGGGGGGNGGGNGNGGNSGGNSSGGNGKGASKGQNDNGHHVNAETGDEVDVDGNKITVQHPDGITETIENGRFRMEDALGRTIIDRQVTPADVSRLKAL